VLDDVERRRFLEQPARKHPGPGLVGPLHVDLNEGAGQLLFLPRCRHLAGAEADHDALPPHRLAGVKRNVLDDPVTLIENPELRDPLPHRRDARLIGARGRGGVADDRLSRIAIIVTASARRHGECEQGGG